MFDIGFGEMILLAAIALIAIGPKQLPEVARVVGRMLNEFKRATGDFTRTVMDARESTNQVLSDTQRSIFESVNRPAQPSDSQAQNEQATAQHPSPESSPENQMSFNLAEGPAAEPVAASAPATEPVKKES